MHVLVATSEHGYSLYDQSNNLKKLKEVKERCEKLQEKIPAADGSKITFTLIPEGTIPQVPGRSFLQNLHSFCPDCDCLDKKIQSGGVGVV